MLIDIQFCQTGGGPFAPFLVSCHLIEVNDHSPLVVICECPIILSNGAGPENPLQVYQLNEDGTVAFFPKEDRLDHYNSGFDDVFSAILGTQTECWDKNQPTWAFHVFAEIHESILLLLCAKKFCLDLPVSSLPKDLIRMLKAMLLATQRDRGWLQIYRRQKEPAEKKRK